MVDQSKVGRRQGAPLWLRIHLQIWKRKLPSLSPEFNSSLNLWRPEEVGLLRGLRRFRHHGSRTVHVVATDLMFGAVAAGPLLVRGPEDRAVGTYHCGNVSSQRMCLLLHVLHPFRDLVWLRLEGPPPGPAISSGSGSSLRCSSEGGKEAAQCVGLP